MSPFQPGSFLASSIFYDKNLNIEQGNMHAESKLQICTPSMKEFSHSNGVEGIFTEMKNPHKCTSCGKIFSAKSYLQRHMLVHSGARPHNCTACGKSFHRLDDLKQHKIIHSRESTHRCTVCRKPFCTLCNLHIHIRSHTGERKRSHNCTSCSKAFLKLCDLMNHMRSHTGVLTKHMLYMCTICSKAFCRRSLFDKTPQDS
uniref:C2H2-type domain-containing protein n=1 Tax=Eptatretus burgeri TaxID=7764 RepID=A0A8C4PX32_EPTBU